MWLPILLIIAAISTRPAEAGGVCPSLSPPQRPVACVTVQDRCDIGQPCARKCCSNGCGHVCMNTDTTTGVCPIPSGFGICVEACVSDADCTPHMCCPAPCGLACTSAVCDATPCAIRCQYGLETDQYGCPLCRCKENPCQTVQCPPGEVCEVINVMCIRHPCPPVAQCVKDPCFLKKKVGPCEAVIPRYFFHKRSASCRQFNYGGCQGNANNFLTLLACQKRCDPCHQPALPGPCKGSFPRWYYDTDLLKCKRFVYGGCEGNENNFTTKKKCRKSCDPCYQKKDRGPCKAFVRRYYFHRRTNKCKRFRYGGCQGNQNNFLTLQDCNNQCLPQIRHN